LDSSPEQPAKSKFKKEEIGQLSKQQFAKLILNMLECIPELEDALPVKKYGLLERNAGFLKKEWRVTHAKLVDNGNTRYLLAYDTDEDFVPNEKIKINDSVL
jgi:hypothetical protein